MLLQRILQLYRAASSLTVASLDAVVRLHQRLMRRSLYSMKWNTPLKRNLLNSLPD